ncbi:MAG: stage III sporulation protein AF [Lachnospiraceae bacterium]|nr:stage III sporulation protein AF [Lachnospiraceae bacterium]
MISGFVEFMQNTGVFMLLAQLVTYLCPEKTYEKYFQLLIGLMLLTRLLQPWMNGGLLAMGNEKTGFQMESSIEEHFREVEAILEQPSDESKIVEGAEKMKKAEDITMDLTMNALQSELNEKFADLEPPAGNYRVTDIIWQEGTQKLRVFLQPVTKMDGEKIPRENLEKILEDFLSVTTQYLEVEISE